MSKPNLNPICPACNLARRICLCAETRRSPKRYQPALWALDMDDAREDSESLAAIDLYAALGPSQARAGRPKPKPKPKPKPIRILPNVDTFAIQ